MRDRVWTVAHRAPVLVIDLADPDDVRWPAYGPAMLAHEIRAVSALPVVVAGEYVGALDLFMSSPGKLGVEQLRGALVAAELGPDATAGSHGFGLAGRGDRSRQRRLD